MKIHTGMGTSLKSEIILTTENYRFFKLCLDLLTSRPLLLDLNSQPLESYFSYGDLALEAHESPSVDFLVLIPLLSSFRHFGFSMRETCYHFAGSPLFID